MDRYFSLNEYLKDTYGVKVAKLSLDAGFSCPNRDGTLSTGGCIFCSEKGSGEFTLGGQNIRDQIAKQKEIMSKKWNAKKYIAYFQNFTNTYGDVEVLRSVYEEALSDPEVVGLAIATRADCLEPEVLDLLQELSLRTNLWLEIGMQSINENTILDINRGYSHKYLDEKLEELRRRNIKFVLHVIFGLPGESTEDMLNSISYANKKNAFGIKIHSLYIQRDSRLYAKYLKEPFRLLTKGEYTDLVVETIGLLNKDIVIHRITGDADKSLLYEPKWATDKLSVIGEINKKLKERNIIQGKHSI